MPVPLQYQRATDDFYHFLLDAREQAGLGSTHQTYTMVQGVFQTFRRRLDIKDAIRFAGVLPPVLRSIFVADWDPDEPRSEFADRQAMTEDVRSLRADHNFSPDSAISDVAAALRRNIDVEKFDKLLESFPEGAREFWKI